MAITLPIYMDHLATTPVAPEVFEAMRPYFCERFGNPASRSHSFGWVAEEAVEQARVQVAHLLGCKAAEIVWTSGATEGLHQSLTFYPASLTAEHFYFKDTLILLSISMPVWQSPKPAHDRVHLTARCLILS